MPTYIIERTIPGANSLGEGDLCNISAKSNAVVAGLGEPYTWVRSYVAGNKIYCIHEAESEETVRRHAQEGGFPVDSVTEISAVFGPETAKAPA